MVEEKINSYFSLKLKELRKKKGLTQDQLANIVGVNYTTVQRWESGAMSPSIDVLPSVAAALDTKASIFIEGEEATPTMKQALDVLGLELKLQSSTNPLPNVPPDIIELLSKIQDERSWVLIRGALSGVAIAENAKKNAKKQA